MNPAWETVFKSQRLGLTPVARHDNNISSSEDWKFYCLSLDYLYEYKENILLRSGRLIAIEKSEVMYLITFSGI